MRAYMNGRGYEFPSAQLGESGDCNDLLTDSGALRDRLADEGYLLVRGFLPRDDVLATRRAIVEELDLRGDLMPDRELMDATVGPSGPSSPAIDSRDPAVEGLFQHPAFLRFFGQFYGTTAMRYPRVLVRIKASGGHTGIHSDSVYIGRGSTNVLTCWTPLGDIDAEQGTLALCAGSHKLDSFAGLRATYGRHDPDRDAIKGANNAPGHFSFDLDDVTDRFGGTWKSANFRVGDVLIFPITTLHCGLQNHTDRYRMSADARFQPADEPVDERFMVNEQQDALLRNREQVARGDRPAITMEQARAKWRI